MIVSSEAGSVHSASGCVPGKADSTQCQTAAGAGLDVLKAAHLDEPRPSSTENVLVACSRCWCRHGHEGLGDPAELEPGHSYLTPLDGLDHGCQTQQKCSVIRYKCLKGSLNPEEWQWPGGKLGPGQQAQNNSSEGGCRKRRLQTHS